jgi:drug/metabolite transporter (DMT)-like permease
MKMGMFTANGTPMLSAWQVGSIRILSSGLVLLPFAIGAYNRIPSGLRGIILLSGWIGSFLPALLFCFAELHIDSALAGTLNSITPLNTLLVGWAIYKIPIAKSKATGILVGLFGSILMLAGKWGGQTAAPAYGLLVVLATLMYGLNVHMVKQKLSGISSLDIASLAFAGLIPFSLALLAVSGFFTQPLLEPAYLKAIGASTLLGVVGTAFASIIFYRLVKTAGPVFASLVTYGIPFVAIGWGIVYGEAITSFQWIALGFILAGVYLTNRTAK